MWNPAGLHTARPDDTTTATGETHHRRALGFVGIETGADTADFGVGERVQGIAESTDPEVEDVVIGQRAGIRPDCSG